MQDCKMGFARLGVLCVLALSGRFASAQEKAAPSSQRVNIQTEVDNAKILAPDNVWVPAAK